MYVFFSFYLFVFHFFLHFLFISYYSSLIHFFTILISQTFYFTRWTEMIHPVPGGPTHPEKKRGGRKKVPFILFYFILFSFYMRVVKNMLRHLCTFKKVRYDCYVQFCFVVGIGLYYIKLKNPISMSKMRTIDDTLFSLSIGYHTTTLPYYPSNCISVLNPSHLISGSASHLNFNICIITQLYIIYYTQHNTII